MTMPADPQSAAAFYRYDHPRFYPDILNDMVVRKTDLGPGDAVALPDLALVNGGRLVWPDTMDKRPLLLVFGSLTCPVTESAAPGLVQLYRDFGGAVRFVLVNVREAHPGARIPQPKTAAAKLANASDLKARHRIPFDVAADDIDGTTHRRFGGRPNSAFVISPEGIILFRAQWANDSAAIGKALADIAAGRPVARPSVSRTLPAMAKMIGYMGPVLGAAGRGASWDTWKVAPPLGVMMLMSELFFFVPRRHRGLAAMVLAAGGLAAAAIYGLAR
jgi:thiol-disulfide isomerase/thioredoxin